METTLHQLAEQIQKPASPSLALVSFNSLGDSLIYLMMAENFRRNGFALTLFGDIPFQLRHWLPNLDIRPYPEQSSFEQQLDAFPLVIISPPSFIREHLHGDLLNRLRQKWFMICQKAPKDWRYDHKTRLQNQLTEAQAQRLVPLVEAAGSIRFRKFDTESVVEMTLAYLHEEMGLEQVSPDVELTPPADLQHRKFRHRIVISPDSAWPEKKDWTPSRFMKLCRLLVARGFEPIIVVAPKNHEAWRAINSGRYLMPQFATIGELAAFIYESGAVIANDSGNGHLASFLNVPIVTIYRKRNLLFQWRPGWGKGKVVCPSIVLPGIKAPIWRPFISPQKILKALQSLLESDPPLVPRNHR